MKKDRKRQQFSGKDYMMVNGEIVEINPKEIPGLPDRCLLAIAIMTTGKKYILEDKRIV